MDVKRLSPTSITIGTTGNFTKLLTITKKNHPKGKIDRIEVNYEKNLQVDRWDSVKLK